jgi:hypothetical protein
MGGPAAGLWLPEQRSALDAAPWLETFCAVRVADDSLDFEVLQPSAIGLQGLVLPAPGSFSLGPEEGSLGDHWELGFPGLDRPPAAELILLATCNSQEDHLLLGHLALFLAGRFNALIDFGGMLGDGCRADAAASLAGSRALVASLPGRVWEMPYATTEESCQYTHVGDREFLAAWLRHPGFRMIK